MRFLQQRRQEYKAKAGLMRAWGASVASEKTKELELSCNRTVKCNDRESHGSLRY